MALKMMNQNILLGMICIVFVLASGASGRATSDGTAWKYCLNPGEGNCPNNAACNQYCLSRPFPGGGKGFVAVVSSSRDGGGDSGSGAMCSVIHTRVSHLHFIGFGFLQVVRIVPSGFGCVFTMVANMVAADFDGGVTVTQQVELCCFMASVPETRGRKVNIWLWFQRPEAKSHPFWAHPNMPRASALNAHLSRNFGCSTVKLALNAEDLKYLQTDRGPQHLGVA
ncbi:hypothetical protein DEO72_LG8g2561 [Vigna unguiculata]|uniref:Uncharacterized protein n=1 Tax=Vigna unguiculata TaxID=3917 RepID=A0A4D6MXB3_VIGUN|nr:hypothetical protein DEO72_LG8g2561 [Vigna unguiculata]